MEIAQGTRTSERESLRPDYSTWARSGAVGGFIAGLTFAAFEMVVAFFMTGSFFGPLRMIAGTVLGEQALTAETSLLTASLVGVAVHMVYSVAAGALFGLIIASVASFRSTSSAIIITSSILGFLMWIVNFFLIAPAFNWSWFPEQSSHVVQFIAHTFFYGTVLGWYLAARKSKHV